MVQSRATNERLGSMTDITGLVQSRVTNERLGSMTELELVWFRVGALMRGWGP